MSSRFCVHELQLPREHGIPLYFFSLDVIACCFARCSINMHKINRKIGVSHHHCTSYCHHHASYPVIAFTIITSLPFATVHSTAGEIMTIGWLLMHGSLTTFQRLQHNILKCIAILMQVPPHASSSSCKFLLMQVPPLHFSCTALPAEVEDLLRRFISGPW